MRSIIIVITIIFLGLIPSVIISAGGMDDNEGNVIVQRMCAVPMNGTAYDCSEHWAMVYYPDMHAVQAPDERWFSGFAVIEDYEDEEQYSICNFFPKIRESSEDNCSIKWFAVGKYKRDICYDGQCYPLVWHEMKHLAQGKWHENMTSSSPFRNVILNGTGNV